MMPSPAHLRSIFLALSMLILGQMMLIGCLKEISLEAPEGNSSALAIRGSLVATEVPYVVVEITKVSNYRASDIPEAVVGAEVILRADSGEEIQLPMRKDGEYFQDLSPAVTGLPTEPGKAYQLSVTTPDGKHYQSTWETLYPVPQAKEITQVSETRSILNDVGNTVEQEFLRFLITTPIVQEGNDAGVFLRWSFSGTFRVTESTLDVPLPPQAKTCYLREVLNLENVVVFSGEESRTEELKDFFLLEEPYNYRFYEGYYLTVNQQSLSESAFRYWDQIGEIVNRSGNFFESPAGKVNGNFQNTADAREEVFGYFYATEEITMHYRVQPGKSRISRLCPASAKPDEDGVNYLCFNCLAHPKSSLDKPAFWVD